MEVSRARRTPWGWLAGLALGLSLAPWCVADEAPLVEHQPSPCTLPDEPFRLCAKVSDDVQVARVRVYLRRTGEKAYIFADAAFDGLSYCATLPAPRAGRVRTLEYHVQALDNAYQAQRTSTFVLQIKPAAECEFAPVEKDPARRAALVVHATDTKQGRKLPDAFAPTGVTFVPVGASATPR